MPLWFAIPGFVLLLLALGCGVYWAIVWGRVYAGRTWLPTLRDGLALDAPTGGWPELCVIVPAHNEEDVIARVASSLLASDYPKLRVAFALDRCTDGTRAALDRVIEGDERAEVIEISDCPADWAGKVHAMHTAYRQAAGAAEAEVVLFADADTSYERGCLKAAVALLRARELDLLSALSTLVAERDYEKVVQPVAAFELVRQFPPDFVNDPKRRRAFANGQFMMFDRGAYDRLGGHTVVKDELLEDIALARKLTHPSVGGTLGCLVADGMMRCEMYRDESAFRRGWSRIFTEAARRRPKRLRDHARTCFLTGVALPAAAAASAIIGALGLAFGIRTDVPATMLVVGLLALGQMALTLASVYRQQHLPVWYVRFYPYGAWRVSAMLRGAASDLDAGVRTEWGGREYAREVRR